MKSLLLSCFLAATSVLFAQDDYLWWNKAVGWDGVTPWNSYINVAAATMGPNALPVQDVELGLVQQQFRAKISGESYISQGDFTNNLFASLNLPLFSDRVSLRIHMVPLEYHQYDTLTRNLRGARDFDGRGFSVGDVYVGTCIQLLKDHESWPDMMLSVNLKTASGSDFDAARYTDAPGYSFNLSSGKDVTLGPVTVLRPFGRMGFFCYQTNLHTYPQNDAFLYGAGAQIKHKSIAARASFDGYLGYLNNGDRPAVLRFRVGYTPKERVEYFVRLQQGLNDYPYSSLRLGCSFRLGSGAVRPLLADAEDESQQD